MFSPPRNTNQSPHTDKSNDSQQEIPTTTTEMVTHGHFLLVRLDVVESL